MKTSDTERDENISGNAGSLHDSRLKHHLLEMKHIEDEIHQLKQHIQKLGKRLERLNESAVAILSELEISKQTITLFGEEVTVYLRHSTYVSMGDEQSFLNWCSESGIDPNHCKQWSAGKMKDLYRERLESKQSMPGGLRSYEKVKVTFRKG